MEIRIRMGIPVCYGVRRYPSHEARSSIPPKKSCFLSTIRTGCVLTVLVRRVLEIGLRDGFRWSAT